MDDHDFEDLFEDFGPPGSLQQVLQDDLGLHAEEPPHVAVPDIEDELMEDVSVPECHAAAYTFLAEDLDDTVFTNNMWDTCLTQFPCEYVGRIVDERMVVESTVPDEAQKLSSK